MKHEFEPLLSDLFRTSCPCSIKFHVLARTAVCTCQVVGTHDSSNPVVEGLGKPLLACDVRFSTSKIILFCSRPCCLFCRLFQIGQSYRRAEAGPQNHH